MKTVLITGATRGFGRAIAEALDSIPEIALVLAVRDVEAGKQVAKGIRGQVEVMPLDMASSISIDRFIAAWDRPLAVLVNNAGLQVHGPVSFTDEGIETTLAVNHLGPLRLALGLRPYLTGGRVIGIGSGTHNPHNRTATIFGFRGGRFTSIEALARGETDASGERQAGMDRYATSKLLSMASQVELARRYPETAFITLDPGMMPGTGLARSAPIVVRLAWNSVLRWLVPLITDASTPERSALAAQKLMLGEVVSGEIYNAAAVPSERVWPKVRDVAFGKLVLDQSLAFLASHAE